MKLPYDYRLFMTMRWNLLILTLFFICKGSACAQTYYYERVAVVENGQKKSASGDGHFITFTSKGCYDSNKSGITEDSNFREYQQTSNGIRSYYGDSYFGKAYYFFSSDLHRLNIKVESTGKIYVYNQSTAPAGVTKSSRKKNTTVASGATPIIPVIVSPGSEKIESPPREKYSKEQSCIVCKGTGKCRGCDGKGWYTTTIGSYVVDCKLCHNSGGCSICHGSGKVWIN